MKSSLATLPEKESLELISSLTREIISSGIDFQKVLEGHYSKTPLDIIKELSERIKKAKSSIIGITPTEETLKQLQKLEKFSESKVTQHAANLVIGLNHLIGSVDASAAMSQEQANAVVLLKTHQARITDNTFRIATTLPEETKKYKKFLEYYNGLDSNSPPTLLIMVETFKRASTLFRYEDLTKGIGFGEGKEAEGAKTKTNTYLKNFGEYLNLAKEALEQQIALQKIIIAKTDQYQRALAKEAEKAKNIAKQEEAKKLKTFTAEQKTRRTAANERDALSETEARHIEDHAIKRESSRRSFTQQSQVRAAAEKEKDTKVMESFAPGVKGIIRSIGYRISPITHPTIHQDLAGETLCPPSNLLRRNSAPTRQKPEWITPDTSDSSSNISPLSPTSSTSTESPIINWQERTHTNLEKVSVTPVMNDKKEVIGIKFKEDGMVYFITEKDGSKSINTSSGTKDIMENPKIKGSYYVEMQPKQQQVMLGKTL